MRNLSMADQVATQHRNGENKIPTLKEEATKYETLNHVSMTAPGGGRIGFMEGIARYAESELSKHKEVYQRLEVSNAMLEYDTSMNNKSLEFKNDPKNVGGVGYYEYINDTHNQISKGLLERASSGEVDSLMRGMLAKGQANWAVNAIQEQKEMMTSHAKNKFRENTEGLYLQARINPSMIDSYRDQMGTALNGMGGMMSASDYEKLKYDAETNLEAHHVLGVIDRDPYVAEKMLASGQVKVSREQADSLLNATKGAIKSKENEAKELQKSLDASLRAQKAEVFAQMSLQMINGELTEEDVKAAEKAKMISIQQEVSLLKSLKSMSNEKEAKETKKVIIAKAVESNLPLPASISPADRENYLWDTVDNINQSRAGSGGRPMSNCEILKHIKENPSIFNVPMNRFQTKISIELSKVPKTQYDVKALIDASSAVSQEDTTLALKGLDREQRIFADVVANVAIGTKDLRAVKAIAEVWNGNVEPGRDALYSKRAEEFIKGTDFKVLVRKGVEDSGWFSGNISKDMLEELSAKAQVYAKTIIHKTGNPTLAENVTKSLIGAEAHETEVMGRTEVLYQPPTPRSTGLTEEAIKNVTAIAIDRAVRNSVEDIVAGTFKGRRRLEKIDSAPEGASSLPIEVLSSKDITKSGGRKIYIDVNNSLQERDLHLEACAGGVGYRVYYLVDKDNPRTKEYLLKRGTNAPEIIRYDLIRASFERKIKAKGGIGG